MNKNITMNFQVYLIEMPNPSTQGSSNETDLRLNCSVHSKIYIVYICGLVLLYTCTALYKGGGSK